MAQSLAAEACCSSLQCHWLTVPTGLAQPSASRQPIPTGLGNMGTCEPNFGHEFDAFGEKVIPNLTAHCYSEVCLRAISTQTDSSNLSALYFSPALHAWTHTHSLLPWRRRPLFLQAPVRGRPFRPVLLQSSGCPTKGRFSAFSGVRSSAGQRERRAKCNEDANGCVVKMVTRQHK